MFNYVAPIHFGKLLVYTFRSAQEGTTVLDTMWPRDTDLQPKRIESPIFNAEGQQWRLTVYPCEPLWDIRTPNGSITTPDSIEVDIDLLSDDATDLWILYQVRVLDGEIPTATTQKVSTLCLGNVARKQMKCEFRIRDRKGAVMEKFEMKKDKLTLLAEITLLEGAGDVWHKIKVPSYTLRSDLKTAMDLKEGMKGEDVTIIASGDDTEEEEPCKFSAHKFILAARSPVFAKMFEHEEMSENKQNEVRIKDIAPDVLEQILKFVYTGEVSNLKEMAIPLLYASEKYELKRLKALCERQLAINVKVENAAHLLVVASQCDAQQLKEVVLKFVALNGQRVMQTNQWDSVEKAGLDKEVLHTIFSSYEVGPPTKKTKLS